MKKKYGIVPFIFLMTIYVFTAYAHPGRTDSSGGHYNNSTGEYHYHHGYPEHQHLNGECPYDYNDKTGEKSNSSGSMISSSQNDTGNYNQGVIDGKDIVEQKFVSFKKKLETIIIFTVVFIISLTTTYIYKIQHLKNKLSDCNKVTENWNYEKYCLNNTIAELNNKIRSLSNKLSETADNLNMLEEQNKNIISYNESLYGTLFSEDIKKMAGIPSKVEFDLENLPHIYTETGNDIFIVYISSSGNRYHTKEGCSNAFIPIHSFKVQSFIPCTKCVNTAISHDYIKWYNKYLKLIDLKNRKTD